MTPSFLSQHFCPVWSIQMYSLSSYCSMLSLNHLTFQNCALITTYKSNAAGSVLLQVYLHLSARYSYCSYLQSLFKIKAFTTELTLSNAAPFLQHFRAPTRCSPNQWDTSLGEGKKGVCSGSMDTFTNRVNVFKKSSNAVEKILLWWTWVGRDSQCEPRTFRYEEEYDKPLEIISEQTLLTSKE